MLQECAPLNEWVDIAAGSIFESLPAMIKAKNKSMTIMQRCTLYAVRSTGSFRDQEMNALRLLCKKMINVQLGVMGCDERKLSIIVRAASLGMPKISISCAECLRLQKIPYLCLAKQPPQK